MERRDTPKRRRRGVPKPEAPKPDAFTQNPKFSGNLRFGFLSDGDIENLKERCFRLLEEYGVVVIHPKAREGLIKAGAKESTGANRLKLPRELVQEALEATPKELTLYAKDKALDLQVPRLDGSFIMRTGTGAHGYVDPRDTKYRNMDLKAAGEIAAIGSGLDQIGFIAHPFVHGVPEVTADIHSFAKVVAHTNKHCWLQPYGKENVEYLLRIAAVAAGGEDQMAKRPLASIISCSFSPLEFKHMDSEVIVQAGKYKMPIHACALPSAGGTAPLTTAGMVLMAAAEILSMVTLTHILSPGTPVIGVPLMFTLDMKTGSALQSCPESVQAASMAIQLMKQGFGLPAHTYGSGSDTPDVDHQSMAERAMLGQTIVQAGADILGGIGQLECATVFSPVQAVLDNEIGAMIRRFMTPPEISDTSLNWEEVSQIRVGGHFLDSTHTLELCRDQHMPDVFLRQGRDDYEKSGRRTAFDAAREKALALIDAAPEEGVLSEDQRREIAEIVAAGDAHIVEKNTRPGAVDVI